ncbi:MAG: transglutaminase family protein [Euryarchaeota archaeon]|nr:transglutaminase family protein [Euryarchaeota archaeon]
MPGRVGPSDMQSYQPQRVQYGMDPRRSAARRQKARRKKKSGKQFRNLVLVIVIAFVFLFTPAQEHVNRQLDIWLGDLWKKIGPAHEYPVVTEYTLQRTIEIDNMDSGDRNFVYRLPIPIQRTNRGTELSTFDRGASFDMAIGLQWVKSMNVGASFSNIGVPVTSEEYLGPESAISLGDGFSTVHWPVKGSGNEECDYLRCLIWKGEIPGNSVATMIVRYEIESSAYTWGADDTISTSIAGHANGMNALNSGKFADLYRPGWVKGTTELIGEEHQWYDRSSGAGQPNWAIDGDHHIVQSIADNILASLPADEQDNIYSFSHAAFIYVRDAVTYGPGSPYPPRSGPTCLAQEIGDCDEQSNAWMSILRTKNIPTWYEFGALTSMDHDMWEAHAWAVVLIPYSGTWCDQNGINSDSCYIEGSVDVVNNKWLLHTPTAFAEFLEPESPMGEAPDEFYKVMSINAFQYNWLEDWETVVGPIHTGGTFKVPFIVGE